MASESPWSSYAEPPNDSFIRRACMDRVAPISVMDPYHHQPPASRRAADPLIRLSIGTLDLDSIGIVKHLFDLRNTNTPFGRSEPRCRRLAAFQTIGRSSTHSVYMRTGWTNW